MSKPQTLLDYVTLAAGHLANHGISTARLDAELLLAFVLQLDRVQLYVQFDRPLTPPEVDQYRQVIARRARREPVAYILGHREFYSLDFLVDRRALIPRPETELLVDTVRSHLSDRFPAGDGDEERFVADIGTGSGAISVALAKNEPKVNVTATDIDPAALQLAGENVRRHGVDQQVTLVLGDLFAPLQGKLFHAIVSNPPYISESDWTTLSSDVKEYEPSTALISGNDGLHHIRHLVAGAHSLLVPKGFLALEIGSTQGRAVSELGFAANYDVVVKQDLAGLDRVVVLFKKG